MCSSFILFFSSIFGHLPFKRAQFHMLLYDVRLLLMTFLLRVHGFLFYRSSYIFFLIWNCFGRCVEKNNQLAPYSHSHAVDSLCGNHIAQAMDQNKNEREKKNLPQRERVSGLCAANGCDPHRSNKLMPAFIILNLMDFCLRT